MLSRLTDLSLEIDIIESALALGYKLPWGFISHYFLTPFITVAPGHTISAPVFGTEMYNVVDTAHALGTEPREVHFTYTKQSQTLTRHALRATVDPDEIRAAMAANINIGEIQRNQVWIGNELRREYEAAALLTNTANYAVGFSETAATKWDAKTGGISDIDPVEVINDRSNTVRQANGINPNVILFGVTAWNAFKNNTYVLDRMPGGSGAEGKKKMTPTPAEAAEWFAIDPGQTMLPEIHVGLGTYRDEVNQVFLDLWPDCVIIGIKQEDPVTSPMPYYGVTLLEQFAEVDGRPITVVTGDYISHPWALNVWAGCWRRHWVAKNDAAYLILSVTT